MTGKEAEKLLDNICITVNKNAIPFDSEKPFLASGIRIGTPAMTTKGFNEEDFIEVGKIIADCLKNKDSLDIQEQCRQRVYKLIQKVTMYKDKSYIKR